MRYMVHLTAGSVNASINCLSGRMVYEGNTITQVAKMLSHASTGQVRPLLLCLHDTTCEQPPMVNVPAPVLQVVCTKRIHAMLTRPDPSGGPSLAVLAGINFQASDTDSNQYLVHLDQSA